MGGDVHRHSAKSRCLSACPLRIAQDFSGGFLVASRRWGGADSGALRGIGERRKTGGGEAKTLSVHRGAGRMWANSPHGMPFSAAFCRFQRRFFVI